MRLDSYAIRSSLLALSRRVPPDPGVLPLSGHHGVAPGVEGKGSRGDPTPEHLGKESRRETSLETSVEVSKWHEELESLKQQLAEVDLDFLNECLDIQLKVTDKSEEMEAQRNKYKNFDR